MTCCSNGLKARYAMTSATDNLTTELLRKLLDERGVKWYETVNHVNCTFTWWESPLFGEVHAMDNEDGETLFMACLNNCDFTPEQAIAATLRSGTLTAEQVMAIAGKHQPDYCSDTHACFDWQAIADELNAELDGGTCEYIIEDNMNETEGMGDVWFRCTNCNMCYEYYADDWLLKMPHCPKCGAAVKGAR